MTLKVNFIGCGKLGKTVAKLLVDRNAAAIVGICNQTLISAEKAITFIGQGNVCAIIADLPPADITFITTPDNQIQICAEQLAQSPNLQPASLVVHCSGLLSSAALIACKQQGCFTYSVHPMCSFSAPDVNVSQYAGTYCALEGCPQHRSTIDSLFKAIGSITYPLNPAKKSAYHAAGVMASNYLITLAENALTTLKNADIPKDMAFDVIINLMKSTLHNLETTRSSADALTGPIQRGDIATVKQHLAHLPTPELTTLYQTLGQATLKLTDLPDHQRHTLTTLLNHSTRHMHEPA